MQNVNWQTVTLIALLVAGGVGGALGFVALGHVGLGQTIGSALVGLVVGLLAPQARLGKRQESE